MSRWGSAHPWNQRTRLDLVEGAARKRRRNELVTRPVRQGEEAEVEVDAQLSDRARRLLAPGTYQARRHPTLEEVDADVWRDEEEADQDG